MDVVRRAAVVAQGLAGPARRKRPNREAVFDMVRQLRCVQLDPISVVARSHRLVLWSRLGPYDVADVDALLFGERRLFEYWAHAASIVLTQDYPIHRLRMRDYARGDDLWDRRVRDWMQQNDRLRRSVLRQLRARGPLSSRAFEDRVEASWTSTGWTNERNVERMLSFLWGQGRILVAGRSGGQKLWDLAERCLPDWTPRERLSQAQAVRRAAEISVRALGVSRAAHVREYFVPGRFPGLAEALAALERSGRIVRVDVTDGAPGPWFVHVDNLPMLGRVASGEWEPRTTLLSPFDNMIRDRKRTLELFGLDYRVEIYVPKAKRTYGYYAMPVLHGERLIGRVDSAVDRANGRLVVNAAHAEPGAHGGRRTGDAIAGALASLAEFVGASGVAVAGPVPAVWARSLR
ncbi:MAG TPA: crosslink repair DNA glycosylase YcaQ family protein [Actinomycetota bacterium]|jgi:hypothetical protein